MGHAPSEVWAYSPRRIAGFLRLANARASLEKADVLAMQTLAARGEPKEVRRQYQELARKF